MQQTMGLSLLCNARQRCHLITLATESAYDASTDQHSSACDQSLQPFLFAQVRVLEGCPHLSFTSKLHYAICDGHRALKAGTAEPCPAWWGPSEGTHVFIQQIIAGRIGLLLCGQVSAGHQCIWSQLMVIAQLL